jgi:hypothetical protein
LACLAHEQSQGIGFGRGAGSLARAWRLVLLAPACALELGDNRGNGICVVLDAFFRQGSPPFSKLRPKRQAETNLALWPRGVITHFGAYFTVVMHRAREVIVA